jgi:hypothetical protein
MLILIDISVKQLQRALSVREQIEELQSELNQILGGSARPGPGRRKMSAAARAKIAAAQRARWAKQKETKGHRVRKRMMSAAARAKIAAAAKARWAKAKAAGRSRL